MELIKIYYNGFRIGDSKELVKARISNADNYADGKESVYMYARNYSDLPRGYGFGVVNNSDSMTDYFESDSARVFPEHPLYKFLRYAAAKDGYMSAKHNIKLIADAEAKGRKLYIAKYKEDYEKTVSDFLAMEDPKQPTKEDMEKLEAWIADKKAKAEAERKAKEEREAEERANEAMIEQLETEITINNWTEKYPVVEGRATVKIEWSERRGIVGGCVWSLKAAQFIFRELDMREHAKKAGYDKTKFLIKWTDEQGDNTYEGRYDIGDGEGGLLEHLYNYAEWYRTHNEFGHAIENPPQTTENLELFKRIVKAA